MKINKYVFARIKPQEIELEVKEGRILLDDMGHGFRFILKPNKVKADVVENHGAEILVSSEEAKAFAEAIMWFFEEAEQ